MFEFLSENSDWLTAIVALIALVQPWILFVWRKYLNIGRIKFYPNDRIEIGFGPYGPSIGLNGTLRVWNRDLFLNSITLIITRQKDKLQHSLDWGFFRDQKIVSSPASGTRDEMTAVLAGGFLISPSQPIRLNTFFHDKDTLSEINMCLASLRDPWYQFSQREGVLNPWDPDWRVRSAHLYSDFENSSIHLAAYTELDQKFYWQPGLYTIEFEMGLSSPDSTVKQKWYFEITEADSKRLRLNIIGLLNATCGQLPAGMMEMGYHFGYSQLSTDVGSKS